MVLSRSVLLALGLPALVRGAQYNLIKEYAGTTFFDGWDFFGNFDNLTHGDANFLNATQAASQRLAFVNPAGNAIMKVDNTTVLPFNSKRDTIRITTKDRFAVGSVWIVDMLHVPYGCSVWPAFWSTAPNWPTGGEIDTFEAVNMVTNAQMALHTDPGCNVVNPIQSSLLVGSSNCDARMNFNAGCVVTNPDPTSYGAAFAAAGGGVFITELSEAGISIWFFPRASVPSVLQGSCTSIDTAAFGIPVAHFPTGGCDIKKFFQPQNLIFDITLCGDFAGNPQVFTATCPGNCYNDYVIGPPSGYDHAYFEVRSVRVFSTSPAINARAVSNHTSPRSAGGAGLAGLSGKRHARRSGNSVHWT